MDTLKEGYYGNANGLISKNSEGRWIVTSGYPEDFPGAEKFNMETFIRSQVIDPGKQYYLDEPVIGYEPSSKERSSRFSLTLNQTDIDNIKASIDSSIESIALLSALMKDIEEDAPTTRVFNDAVAYGEVIKKFFQRSYGRKGIKTTLKFVLLAAVKSPQLNGMYDLVEDIVGLNHLKNLNRFMKS